MPIVVWDGLIVKWTKSTIRSTHVDHAVDVTDLERERKMEHQGLKYDIFKALAHLV